MARSGLRGCCAGAALGIAALSGCGGAERDGPRGFARIPAGAAWLGSAETRDTHPPRRAEFAAFRMGRAPVTVAEYVEHLNAIGPEAPAPGDPSVAFRGGRWRAARGAARRPVTGVTRAEAEDYCRRLSIRLNARARLPTADEWEYAARGGIDGGRYPWGWGSPEGRVLPRDAEGVRPVGRFPANPFGLTDLVGHVYQWCADTESDGRAIACGGSWAERDPRFLRVFHRVRFPADYRGHDLGFRVLIEESAK